MNDGEFIALLHDTLEKAGQIEAELAQLAQSKCFTPRLGAGRHGSAGHVNGASSMAWQLAAMTTAIARDATLLCAKLDGAGAWLNTPKRRFNA